MTKTLLGALAVGTLVFAACGSDSGGGDGGGGSQKDVADLLIKTLDEQEISYDENCIRDKASQLSDDDAKLIADAGPEGDPEVSDEANAIGDQLIDCFDLGS